MRSPLRKLDGFPLFLAYWALFVVGIGGGTLVAIAMWGGSISSGAGPVGKILGPAFAMAGIAAGGERARRRKAQDQGTMRRDDSK